MRGKLALLLGSVLFVLLALEIACRLARGPDALWHWPNIILAERRATIGQGAGRLVHDKRLGFVASPGYAKDGVSYDERGYRLTPVPAGATLAEPPILVVGDSYAHGDELSDAETWAALIQARTGRRTVNAAMSGYGLDQIVLRAEKAAAEIKPAAIVLSFIADDLRRAEMKRVWGAEKPYFELVDGKPVLRNVPTPLPPDPADTLDLRQRLFGWSVLVDTVLRHQGWQYEWSIDHVRALPRHEGEKLACPLLQRLAGLGVPTLVVAEHDPYGWKDADYAREQRRVTELVLACARQQGFVTLDLFATIDRAVRSEGYDAVFRSSHPGPLAARLAAQAIADKLRR